MRPFWVKVDPGVKNMKENSIFPKVPELEPQLQMHFCYIQATRQRSFTLLQRCSRCIPHSQPNGHQDTRWGSLTPLQRCSPCIVEAQLTGPQDTCRGSLTPLQRGSRCIVEAQVTGPLDSCWGSLTPL